MSGRTYRTPKTQGLEHVYYALMLKGNTVATNPPVLVEGDPNSSFVTVARTSTGVYTITTVDGFPGCLGGIFQMAGTTATVYESSVPVTTTGNAWTFTLTVKTTAALEMTAGMNMRCLLMFRNTIQVL